MYYLRAIETKTHLALFDISERKDSYSAKEPEFADTEEDTDDTDKLYKLNKIRLFGKKTDGGEEMNTAIEAKFTALQEIHEDEINIDNIYTYLEPIKNIHFKYIEGNDELCKEIPNADSGSGKLTLKKIWTEYKNVASYTISPYEFAYTYPNNNFTTINASYNFGNYGNTLEQNPNYTTTALDSWQNYRAEGVDRQTNMQPWVDQSPITATFDPAAWQLKQITLPSGGQILVQYEQDDYSYVQDKLAHAMVKCSTIDESGGDVIVKLDLSDLDANNTAEDVMNLINKIYNTEETYTLNGQTVKEKKRIYFKFLYSLFGNMDTCSPNGVGREFIDGYAQLKEAATFQGTSIKLIFDGKPMKKVCNYYLKAEANHRAEPGAQELLDDGMNIREALAAVWQEQSNIGAILDMECFNTCPAHSYIRIPIRNKKGGGIRVKRLLTYNPDIPSETSLYGNEYLYKKIDKTLETSNGTSKLVSSGVATNEPSAAREENILVDFIPRFKQGWFNKLVAGEDKEVLEGPLGESLLPPPSVGYSQVIVRNIHGGITNPGFTINRFHTVQEYPFKAEMSDLEKVNHYSLLYTILFNTVHDKRWRSQGFRFLVNDMHGQVESATSYSGNYNIFYYNASNNEYNNLLTAFVNNTLGSPVTSTSYEYFEQGALLPTITAQTKRDPRALNFADPAPDGKLNQYVELLPLGQEIDVTTEDKKIVDEFDNAGIEYDGGALISYLFPIPAVSATPELTISKNKLYTHAITKVVHYPTVLKKVTSTANGLTNISENYLFSRETGEPIVTLNYTPIEQGNVPYTDRGYVNYNFPASMQYANMSQKAKNARMKFTSGTINTIFNTPTLSSLSPSITNGNYQNYFSKGDIVYYEIQGAVEGYWGTVTDILDGGVKLAHNYNSSSLPTGNVVNIEIVRSGNTNQLSAMAGNFTAYKIGATNSNTAGYTSPQGSVTANWTSNLPDYLTIPSPNSLSSYTIKNVVSASATVFGDQWEYQEKYEHYYPYINGVSPCSANGYYNNYESNKKGKWRPKASFVYEAINEGTNSTFSLKQDYLNGTSTIAGYPNYVATYTNPYTPNTNSTDKNYETGVFSLDIFSWNKWNQTLLNNSTPNTPNNELFVAATPVGRWLRTNLINKYSPHGDPLEESNILGIKSCAKYGYNKTLPYLTAQNAEYNSVYFESFENTYTLAVTCGNTNSGNIVEDECNVTSTVNTAHSGYRACRLSCNSALGSGTYFTAKIAPNGSYGVTSISPSQVYTVMFWARYSAPSELLANEDEIISLENMLKVYNTTANQAIQVPSDSYVPIKYIATSGNWHLFKQTITVDNTGLWVNFYRPPMQGCSPFSIYIDDIRIQPIDAQMNCYVYDNKTQQLLTTFDDQHFGTYYQYNEKGQLVRKIIETERGKKTVQENQYNIPKVAK